MASNLLFAIFDRVDAAKLCIAALPYIGRASLFCAWDLPIFRQQVLLAGKPGRFATARHSELGEDRRDMMVDRLGRDVKLRADPSVAEAVGQAAQDLHLAHGQ